MLKIVTNLEDYEKIKNKYKYTIFYFSSFLCGPCRLVFPTVINLKKKITDAHFFEVDSDRAKDICDKLGIHSLPTFIFFKEGKEMKRLVTSNQRELRKSINIFIDKPEPKSPGTVDTLAEFEKLVSTKQSVSVLFNGKGFLDFEDKINEYYQELKKLEKYKNIEMIIIDPYDTKEYKEIREKTNCDKFFGFVFFKNGKEESRFEGKSKRLLNENLEKLIGLPSSNPNLHFSSVNEYKDYVTKNNLVCAWFLSEWNDVSEKAETLYKQFEKDTEFANVKFIRVFQEENKEIFDKEAPLQIIESRYNPVHSKFTRIDLLKDGISLHKYFGEDEKFLRKYLCKLTGKPLPKVEGEINILNEFEEFIKKNKIVVVGFYSSSPNETLPDFYGHLRTNKEYSSLKFITVDIEEAKEINDKYQLKNYQKPGFLIFKDGNLLLEEGCERILVKKICELAEKPTPRLDGYIYDVKEYDNLISSCKYLIAFYVTDGVTPFLARKYEESLKEKYNQIQFMFVEADQAEELSKKNGCNKPPLTIFYENGKETTRTTSDRFEEIIERIRNLFPSED